MRCIIALVPGGYEQAQDSAEDIERCKEKCQEEQLHHFGICESVMQLVLALWAVASQRGYGATVVVKRKGRCFLRQRRREITQHLLEFLGTPPSLQVASSDSCEARSGVGIDEFDPSQRSLEESILHKIGATPGNQLASCEM